MNRFKYTLLVSGLGSNMAERRAWAWICRCFTISFGRCRCWVSRSPPWPGTRLRCGPTSSWLISPLPGGCFSVVFLVFYVAFLQKWPALASGGCYSHFPHWSHLQVELRTRALCSVPGSWTMQARDGTSRDISVPWMGTTSPGGIQHHSANQQRRTFPTTNCNHLRPDSWLPPVAWSYHPISNFVGGEALLYFDHVHLQEVRPTPKGWKMLEGFRMPEMDWHLWGLVEPFKNPEG